LRALLQPHPPTATLFPYTTLFRSNGLASGGEVGPRRKKSCSRRKRPARITKHEHKRKRETAARRIPGNDNTLWGIAFNQEAAIRGNSVIHGGGKRIFWGEAIIRSENPETLHRKVC